MGMLGGVCIVYNAPFMTTRFSYLKKSYELLSQPKAQTLKEFSNVFMFLHYFTL